MHGNNARVFRLARDEVFGDQQEPVLPEQYALS